MPTIVFCSNCADKKQWPRPPIRVTTDPCEVCGGWDAYRTRRTDPRTGEVVYKTEKLNNYEQDARFLPGTPQETRLQDPIGG